MKDADTLSNVLSFASKKEKKVKKYALLLHFLKSCTKKKKKQKKLLKGATLLDLETCSSFSIGV